MFATRMKNLREERGYSLQYVADRCDISKSAVAMYEMGKRNPKIETLEALADLYNVDIDYLLGNSDIRNAYAQKNPTAISDGLTGNRKKLIDYALTLSEEEAGRALQVLKLIVEGR